MSTSEPPYRFEDAPGYSVIVVQPKLNDSQWSEFENVGNELLGRLNQAKTPAFMVDLSGLSYMGSAMVALIVRLWKAVKERNGKMVVVNRHPMVYEVLKLAGLHNVWTIVETRDQGLKLLGKKGESTSDGSGALIGLGVLGVVAGAIGLALLFDVVPVSVSKKIAMACTLGGAAIGLFAGTVCAAKGTGSKQKAGIGFAVASAVILILGILNMPSGQAPAQNSGPAPAATPPAESNANTAAPAADGEKAKGGRRGRGKDDDAAPAAQPADANASAAPADAGATPAAPAETKADPAAPAAAAPEGETKVEAPTKVKGLLNKGN